MSNDGWKTLKVRVPDWMYEKIAALIESENLLSQHGPVSVADWICWAASYCMERQAKAIHAFRRSTFECDGCHNSLRYTALAGVMQRDRRQFCYCGDCWVKVGAFGLNPPIEPKETIS